MVGAEYIAGFVDADGCFSINKSRIISRDEASIRKRLLSMELSKLNKKGRY